MKLGKIIAVFAAFMAMLFLIRFISGPWPSVGQAISPFFIWKGLMPIMLVTVSITFWNEDNRFFGSAAAYRFISKAGLVVAAITCVVGFIGLVEVLPGALGFSG